MNGYMFIGRAWITSYKHKDGWGIKNSDLERTITVAL